MLNEKNDALSRQVKTLEARLNEAYNIFNFHSSPIVITNSKHQILLANDQALNLFNADQNQVYSVDFLNQLFKDREKQKWNLNLLKLQQYDQVKFEINISFKKKPSIYLEVVSLKLAYQGQQCVLSYLRNITDQKLAEKTFRQEHEAYHHVLDAIPAMVFIKDADGRIISINKMFEEITGLKKFEILGKRLFELTDNHDIVEKYWRDDLEVLETGVAKRNIIEPLFTDPTRWFITDKIPFHTSDGELKGIIGFSMDITERKHAEEALIKSEKKFRLLFNTSPDGIMVGNLEGDFYSANKTFLDMVGYTMPELLNKKYHDVVPEKWIKQAKKNVDDLNVYERSEFSLEMELINKKGSIIPVLVSAWIMFNENKIPKQLGAYVKDLSVTKRAEQLEKELLKKEKEQLERDLHVKNRELNTRITQLIETNELVNGVISKLNDAIKADKELKNRQIQFIINDLVNHSNEELWQEFEITFGQVHPSFYQNLYVKYPKLTPNERKLCAFLKMNLSTKDISSITHQSIRSIEVARFRLRKKMDLPRTINLPKFLSNF